MNKYIILAILITSCSTRKVAVEKSVEEKKEVIIENTIETKKIDSVVNNNIETVEIEVIPIDSCKEIVVEGKVYKNVRLRLKKVKDNTKAIKTINEDKTIQKEVKNEVKAVKKEKQIERTSFNWWLLIWIIPLLIFLFRNEIKKRLLNL